MIYDVLMVLVALIIWLALQKWVFPKFGIRT